MDEHPLTLMRAVRALAVGDVEVCPDGVTRPGGPLVDWSDVAQAIGADDPTSRPAQLRLALLLRLRRLVHALGPRAADTILQAARPLALPVGHPLHPGAGWVGEDVPGGLLQVGLGVAGLLPGQDGVLPVGSSVLAACGLVAADAWAGLAPLTERLGGFALDRISAPSPTPAALRGVGGCDALTLLSLAPVRRGLPADTPGPFSAPSRDRVWIGEAAADRAYVRAVWMLTAPVHRGVLEPMALTAHGIVPHGPHPRPLPPITRAEQP